MEMEKDNNIMNNRYLNSYLDEDEKDKETTYIYYKNTYVYGWGKNKYGELGIGHTENTVVPSPIKTLQNLAINQVSSGGKHTAILTKEGKLYICGTDVLGLLGVENKKWKEQHKFQKMYSLDFEFITQIACAEFHSLCLSKEGYVFAWGGNLHNKLGQINSAGVPMKINSLQSRKITQISCGDYHSTALAETGEVFSWGGGGQYNRGQCGHGDLKEVEAPKRIDFFKQRRVSKVVCGGYHTIVLCQDNTLHGFGKGTYGQCGYGVSEDTSIPKLIKFTKKSVHYEQNIVNKNDITNNMTMTMFNPEDTQNASIYKSPVLIKDFKCGGEHTIVLSSFGRVYTFGHGYTGQLGLNNTKNFDRPMIVKSLIKKTVNQIAAGWSHSMILTSEGNLYIAGCGKYGELGLHDCENKKSFTLVRSASMLNITNIYAGGHHSWLITDYISPERSDFEIPSPLGSGNFSPTMQKSTENSPRNAKPNSVTINNNNNTTKIKELQANRINNNIKFNLDMLNEKLKKQNKDSNNNRLFLQVAYTDLKMAHRFVRFTITPNSKINKDGLFREMNNMVNECYNEDQCVVVFRLQDDNEVDFKKMNPSVDAFFKDFKTSLKLLDDNTNKRSFSLMVVYDVSKNEHMVSLRNSIENVKIQNEIFKKNAKKSLYDVVSLTEEDIKNSQVEEIMSSWMFEFVEKFSEFFDIENDAPRFLELRPNSFLI